MRNRLTFATGQKQNRLPEGHVTLHDYALTYHKAPCHAIHFFLFFSNSVIEIVSSCNIQSIPSKTSNFWELTSNFLYWGQWKTTYFYKKVLSFDGKAWPEINSAWVTAYSGLEETKKKILCLFLKLLLAPWLEAELGALGKCFQIHVLILGLSSYHQKRSWTSRAYLVSNLFRCQRVNYNMTDNQKPIVLHVPCARKATVGFAGSNPQYSTSEGGVFT